jgi:hypothetical protein
VADEWLSTVWPPDAAVAIRSYPRRFRALLAALDEDERPDDLPHRPGADGRSALDHAADAAATFRLVADAVRLVVSADRPDVPDGAVSEAGRPAAPVGGSRTTEGVLGDLAGAAEALASIAGEVAAVDWQRTGVVAGTGREVTALDLLREAVRTGRARLGDAQRVLSEVRGRPLDVE